jgi:hypothetical protein
MQGGNPVQYGRRMKNIDEENPPKSFAVKCEDRSLWHRIRRAAKFNHLTAKEFCWRAIAGSVGAAEDDMIFGPTGEIIGDKFELEELLLAANNAS